MSEDVNKSIEELERINKLIDQINNDASQCEKLAMEIHWKLSPFGLRGKQGILRDTLPMQNLAMLSMTVRYTLDCLQGIMKNLNEHKELANQIKYKNYK